MTLTTYLFMLANSLGLLLSKHLLLNSENIPAQ